jgi:glycosyltransferase involved in cell wall biosynthesis
MGEFSIGWHRISHTSGMRHGSTVPRVSVITATYNRSEVLRYAIESVRRQTYRDWEHIIVGDACTDGSEALVRSFDDARLRFVNRAENFGEQSRPNNDGVALAQGELIAYLNHDDLWFPDHLASLTAALHESRADLVHAPLVGVDAHGMARCALTNTELRYDPSHFVPASLWLHTRALAVELGGWRPASRIHASNPSQDFLVRAWRRGKLIACVPRVTALILPSGGRPDSYVKHDAWQHATLFSAMEAPDYRERLLTRMVLESERERARLELGARQWRGATEYLIDRLLIAARLHPDAVRNRLAGKPKGHWIAHLRAFRGLPPLRPRGRRK